MVPVPYAQPGRHILAAPLANGPGFGVSEAPLTPRASLRTLPPIYVIPDQDPGKCRSHRLESNLDPRAKPGREGEPPRPAEPGSQRPASTGTEVTARDGYRDRARIRR